MWATLSDAQDYQLWGSSDGTDRTAVEVPRQPSTAGDHALVIAADGGQVFATGADR